MTLEQLKQAFLDVRAEVSPDRFYAGGKDWASREDRCLIWLIAYDKNISAIQIFGANPFDPTAVRTARHHLLAECVRRNDAHETWHSIIDWVVPQLDALIAEEKAATPEPIVLTEQDVQALYEKSVEEHNPELVLA